ncbi:MAG: hypothetical protein GXP63_04665 [DPANN group archaeon]|nr:hypothetical protein [DPANN group archaeon]
MAPNPKKTSKGKKSSRAKKKLWFSIISPKGFNAVSIGETSAFEASNLPGRAVKVNLMNLTNDPRGQHVNITFKIDKIVGTTAETQVFKYEIIPAHFKRLVRRNRDRVDHSFLCRTNDGITVRVKFILITRFKVNKSTQSALRKSSTDLISAIFSKLTLENVFKDIIFNKVQKLLRGRMAKIAPLRNFEIKVINIDKNKRGVGLVTPSQEALDSLEHKPAPPERDHKVEHS